MVPERNAGASDRQPDEARDDGSADGASAPLVVVANRLPVERQRDQDGTWQWKPSAGGLVTALEPIVERSGGVWIGWPGVARDPDEEPMQPFEVAGATEGKPLRIVPVELSEDEVERYYEGFSNATLWPLYHDVITQPEYHRIWWEAYEEVNERFAEAVAATAQPGARVWVQDYQLQLVPRLVRRLRPDVSIGYFDHIPFPPYGLYAQLPWRRRILEGLLGADLIGFQRIGDARNFAQAVRRLLGATVHQGRVEVPAGYGVPIRSARFGAFPISVDAASWSAMGADPQVRERATQIRGELGNPETVLLGVDRLDYTKGIGQRLKAYGELLAEGGVDVRDVVLVEMAVPTRGRVPAYQDLRDDVELAVSRINGRFSTVGRAAVSYMHRSMPRREIAALYVAADVLLVTSVRDGMNLVAKEYVAARTDNDGVLILSEFTGAADELRQALIVNPHDVDDLKEAIVRATNMPIRERRRRMRQLRRTVRTHDVDAWSNGFLEELTRASGRARQERAAQEPTPQESS